MFSFAYVILPVSFDAPAEAIRTSLALFERGTRGTMPEHRLAFDDDTAGLRETHEARLVFTEDETGGLRIEGARDVFYLDCSEIRNEMKRRGLRRWRVRFADEMELGVFFDRFGSNLERYPETGAFGRWLNPLGRWDWWDPWRAL